MAKNKTTQNEQSVEAFLNGIVDEKNRAESIAVVELMKQATGMEPKMWGSSIIGFGSYHYKYASGREGDNMVVGFSPRSQALTFYNMNVIEPDEELRAKLGKHTFGKGCLYIKKLADVDVPTFKQVIEQSVKHIQAEYGKK